MSKMRPMVWGVPKKGKRGMLHSLFNMKKPHRDFGHVLSSGLRAVPKNPPEHMNDQETTLFYGTVARGLAALMVTVLKVNMDRGAALIPILHRIYR